MGELLLFTCDQCLDVDLAVCFDKFGVGELWVGELHVDDVGGLLLLSFGVAHDVFGFVKIFV